MAQCLQIIDMLLLVYCTLNYFLIPYISYNTNAIYEIDVQDGLGNNVRKKVCTVQLQMQFFLQVLSTPS